MVLDTWFYSVAYSFLLYISIRGILKRFFTIKWVNEFDFLENFLYYVLK